MPELHVFIEQGRTLQEKRKLVRELTEVFVRNLDVAPEAVMIQIIEGPKRLSTKRRASAQRSTGRSLH
jgi:4-oxalocrotonate tautomerase